MFQIRRPAPSQIDSRIAAASALPPVCPALLTLNEGLLSKPLPLGFAHDLARITIGVGEKAFNRAHQAFIRWAIFDLGWVRVANPTARIAPGQLVAVEARTARLWTLNVSRIAETINISTRFGFLYETTRAHVEEGQERFLIEFDPASGKVTYLIEAVSRPRHLLARLGWRFTRAMQHRFVRDSQARICTAVTS